MSYSGRRLRADPFTDLLFNVLLSFTLLMFLAIIFMNPIPKTGVINPKAEYIITVSWKDNNPDDIDTYVQSPTGDLVWFRGKEAGFVHLDRDDRGLLTSWAVRFGLILSFMATPNRQVSNAKRS